MFFRLLFGLLYLPFSVTAFDAYNPAHHKPRQVPASFDSLALLLREIRRELGETRRETRDLFNALQYEINYEIRELRNEVMRIEDRDGFFDREVDHHSRQRTEEQRDRERPPDPPLSRDVREIEKRMKRGFRKITEQGEEIRNELRSQKAELYAVRNSVYDTREEILQKNNVVIRGIQAANDTFVCYMHAMRKKLYQVNNNIATVVREQQMLVDSLQRPHYSSPEAFMPTASYDEPFEDERIDHQEPSASDRFLPGCTKNPLETQETLETFGIIFSNETTMAPDPYLRGGHDRIYGRQRGSRGRDRDRPRAGGKNARGKARHPPKHYPGTTTTTTTGFDRIRAGLDSLFPSKPEDCQEDPETYLEYPPMPRDCQDVFDLGFVESGVYRIQATGLLSREVMCDQTTQGGGWTVIIARKKVPRHISFNRTWTDYELGFGEPSREYWIGLEPLHFLTRERSYSLRADMEDWEGRQAWAAYNFFSVAGPDEHYRLRVSGYTGTAGDSMRHSHLQMFSTVDRDNDQESWGSCSRGRGGGGWWWGRCSCTQPTGQYRRGRYHGAEKGVTWWHWKDSNYPLKTLILKIRPV
ncbi:Fibrinogen alpha/beta/gamma chain C-terminal globular domain, partial [Trinorchestia longiramus]